MHSYRNQIPYPSSAYPIQILFSYSTHMNHIQTLFHEKRQDNRNNRDSTSQMRIRIAYDSLAVVSLRTSDTCISTGWEESLSPDFPLSLPWSLSWAMIEGNSSTQRSAR